MNIAIVGAGIAGLTCADALRDAGHAVTLFDKGRAPGGRMSTRRIDTADGSAQFDHGAQYFTVRDPAFRACVDRWQQAGLAAPWPAAGADAWVGIPAMTAPARAMAPHHDIRFPVEITALHHDGQAWQLEGAGFDTVLLALPAENAARLLPPDHPFATLAAATPSAPCWTVMAAFAERLAAPDILRGYGPIGWAARNSAKPGRHGPESWVVQAGPEWSPRQSRARSRGRHPAPARGARRPSRRAAAGAARHRRPSLALRPLRQRRPRRAMGPRAPPRRLWRLAPGPAH